MVQLVQMSQSDFDVFLPGALKHLASELGRARGLSAEDALRAAQQSFDSLFRDGRVDSADQFIYNVYSEGKKVGMLHFGVRRDRSEPYVYVWDLMVDPSHRGKGLGEQIMLALENEARKLGHSEISLNVFGHNAPAISLYKKIGYNVASMTMAKNISPIYIGEK